MVFSRLVDDYGQDAAKDVPSTNPYRYVMPDDKDKADERDGGKARWCDVFVHD